MSSYQPSSLSCFLVFNPTLGDEFSEEKKILACYPKQNVEVQKMHVGLSEGLIGFTREFSPNAPIDSMQTEKHRYTFFECEPEFWMLMIVNNPLLVTEKSSEAVEDELDDAVLCSLLFNGTMSNMISTTNVSNLSRHLDLFLQYYISTVKFNQLRFFIDITGYQFHPVDKGSYLAAICLSHTITDYLSYEPGIALIFEGKLMWSNLSAEMKVLYNLFQENFKPFFTYFCLNDHLGDKQTISTDAQREFLSEYGGSFLTGPMKKGIHTSYAPRVYNNKTNSAFNRLVVYQVGKLSILLTLEDSGNLHDVNFYQSLVDCFGADAKALNKLLTENDEPVISDFRFLYFNSMNLALKTSLPLSVETIKVLRNMHHDFIAKTISESIVRTRSDGWVVGRCATQTNREFFVLIDGVGGSDISEISAEVDRLAASNFNIFIQKVSL